MTLQEFNNKWKYKTDFRKMWMIEVWVRMLIGKVIKVFKG